ncbi:MAG TPA: FAD-dependent oxidoreductase [Verrucomicrobiae bacterium]|nr:FAD-dependent oxidoreductase [Verrucomicrobiae bacterium]
MPTRDIHSNWGAPPWTIDFNPSAPEKIHELVDFAIVGAGFTGLAAAAWLRHLAPEKSVLVFEAGAIGAGASGRTGGMALAETAAGDQPGLGDVLAGFQEIQKTLGVACDLDLRGAWEIARTEGRKDSPIAWSDSGSLRVVNEVPGGTLDPGKLVAGLARAAESRGVSILENHPVEAIEWPSPITLAAAGKKFRARQVLLATNALALDLAGEGAGMHPRLTLALLAEPVPDATLAAIGLGEKKPFYTVDFPYLWGRVRPDNSVVWGAGLVSSPDERRLDGVDIAAEEPARIFAALEERVRGLHPALAGTEFTHRWGGPILFRDSWAPVFGWHPASRDGIVLGAFAGHGVALSSYLGAWAAEALLARRDLPSWGKLG